MFYNIQHYLTNSGWSSLITLIYIEVKDYDKDYLEESTGLATYSNSESTVFSYISIFKNFLVNRLDQVFN